MADEHLHVLHTTRLSNETDLDNKPDTEILTWKL